MALPIIDKEQLTELWRKGYPVAKIAEMTGWKMDTIYKCAHRINLPKRQGGVKSLLDRDSEKKQWFIRNYPNLSNEIIASYLDLNVYYIEILGCKYHLQKSPEYRHDTDVWRGKKLKAFHATKKGDTEYYKYNIRKRVNGKFVKTKTD